MTNLRRMRIATMARAADAAVTKALAGMRFAALTERYWRAEGAAKVGLDIDRDKARGDSRKADADYLQRMQFHTDACRADPESNDWIAKAIAAGMTMVVEAVIERAADVDLCDAEVAIHDGDMTLEQFERISLAHDNAHDTAVRAKEAFEAALDNL